jgi:uncharacterized protein YjiS (DUF1127 family)
MSVFVTNRSVPLGAESALGVTSFVERTIAAIRGWALARSTSKALGKLSNRELDDIGLLRADIAEVAERLSRRTTTGR